jgi:signal transduction histidine kinase/HAMP domain-containing protein/ActR/RegA family two-component response regulator
MIAKVLSPIYQRTSVGAKLVALIVCMGLPIVVLTHLYLASMQADIAFTRREIVGVDYARAAWPALYHAALPEGAKSQTMMARAARDLRNAKDAETLGVRDQALTVINALEAYTSKHSSTRDSHQRIIALTNSERLMRDIADKSNLILDPELDTYYLMDLTMLHLPSFTASLQNVSSLVHEIKAKPATRHERMLVLRLGAFTDSLETLRTAGMRAAEAQSDPALRKELIDEIERLVAAGEALSARYDSLISDVDFHDQFDRQMLVRTLAKANIQPLEYRIFAATDQSWRLSQDALRALLSARLTRLHNEKLAGLLFSGDALLLAIVLAWLITISIVRPQRRLVQAMRDISQGNVRAFVPFRQFKNEIGETANAVEFFRGAMIERQMFEADLDMEREHLEERVLERTAQLDMTRQRAEESARAAAIALQQATAGVWRLDLQSNEYSPTPEWLRVTGLPEDCGIAAFTARIHPDDLKHYLKASRNAVRDGRIDVSYRYAHPDGAERWLKSVGARLEEANAFIGLTFDVTTAKLREMELADAREKADAANQAKSEFLATMSHEIRTPLNGVLAMAAALNRTQLLPNQKEMVHIINQSGESLLAILNDVLDISKIEAGRLSVETVEFDLGETLESVAALYREAASKKGLMLQVTLSGDAEGRYLGDPLRVRQILQNFTSNAIKFSDRGEVLLSVSKSEDGLMFNVVDQGIGMSEEQLSRMFQKFSQADGSITRRYGGTGLGLSICRELAELMGGAVGVTSAPGAGSTFWLKLPLEQVSVGARTRADEDGDAEQDLPPLRILAADDNAANRLVLKVLLDQFGLQADFVENGALALQAAQLRDYDIILMDVHMPEMDGMAATRAIRVLDNANARIPIIALTADVLPEHVQKCRDAGMNRHVAKPIKPDLLIDAIAAALEEAEAANPEDADSQAA